MCVTSNIVITYSLNEASLLLLFNDVVIDGQEIRCLFELTDQGISPLFTNVVVRR